MNRQPYSNTASQASLKAAMISPQKFRLVADMVRGRKIEEANRLLLLDPKKGSKLLLKVLRSAMANAQQKGTADLERLYVSELKIDAGPVVKRFMPRAQGRADVINKRTSHVFLRLSEKTATHSAVSKKKGSSAKSATSKKTTKKKSSTRKKTSKKSGDK